MKKNRQEERRRGIEAAAYALLARNGYAGTSMLSIAKRAKASNETLYKWYGDKLSLFRSMIENNAADVKALLEDALDRDVSPRETLDALGPLLLAVLLGDRAVTLNQAAASDASGVLGETLAAAGRNTIMPLVAAVFERAGRDGLIRDTDPAAAANLYLDLLVGDLQIRRVIGAIDPLDAEEISCRAQYAATATMFFLTAGIQPRAQAGDSD